ncbi:hypothetical protein OF83DRAFT_1281688 [Amylostereum chailletii]|nr:hypothetical protein OF83DRAFT_1281688 [Amylostereum chailletii]
MLPSSSQTFSFPSTSQQTFFSSTQPSQSISFGDLSFTSSQPFNSSTYPGSQSLTDASNLDPNNVEIFKENLQLVQNQTAHLQNLAEKALEGIRSAYHADADSAKTAAHLAELRQAILDLQDLLISSGIGGLPLLALDTPHPPPEEQLANHTANVIKELFTLRTRQQEAAIVAANLLTAPDHSFRR